MLPVLDSFPFLQLHTIFIDVSELLNFTKRNLSQQFLVITRLVSICVIEHIYD